MNTFEWVLIALTFVGVVIPIWLFFAAAFMMAKRPRTTESSARYFAYTKLLDLLHSQIQNEGIIANGAIWAATVRELQSYPEFRDISLLYLEEINITGSNKFDDVMRSEIKATEAHLLGLKDE